MSSIVLLQVGAHGRQGQKVLFSLLANQFGASHWVRLSLLVGGFACQTKNETGASHSSVRLWRHVGLEDGQWEGGVWIRRPTARFVETTDQARL